MFHGIQQGILGWASQVMAWFDRPESQKQITKFSSLWLHGTVHKSKSSPLLDFVIRTEGLSVSSCCMPNMAEQGVSGSMRVQFKVQHLSNYCHTRYVGSWSLIRGFTCPRSHGWLIHNPYHPHMTQGWHICDIWLTHPWLIWPKVDPYMTHTPI